MLAMAALAACGFLYVDRAAAQDLLWRWKPQVAAGNIVSVTGVKRYARARIELERADPMGALVDVAQGGHLFVVHHAAPNATVLEAVVWAHPDADRAARFRALRAWHAGTFPGAVLSADELADDEDRTMWYVSEYDV